MMNPVRLEFPEIISLERPSKENSFYDDEAPDARFTTKGGYCFGVVSYPSYEDIESKKNKEPIIVAWD